MKKFNGLQFMQFHKQFKAAMPSWSKSYQYFAHKLNKQVSLYSFKFSFGVLD